LSPLSGGFYYGFASPSIRQELRQLERNDNVEVSRLLQQKLLIVDDEQEMNDVTCLYLTKNYYECLQAFDGTSALALAREHCPNLIILDINLPGPSGIELCQILRRETDAPILFLSCLGETHDKILGLSAGGDDYITKPFSLAELLARVKAALRRSGLPNQAGIRKQFLDFPGLRIDLVNSVVIVNDIVIDLPPREFQLLARLARNPGWTYTAEQLFSLVWGADSIDTRTVAVHINRLRKKLSAGSDLDYILTAWGKGYKFNDLL
jgi:DNA-binding response OmpR family regulator